MFKKNGLHIIFLFIIHLAFCQDDVDSLLSFPTDVSDEEKLAHMLDFSQHYVREDSAKCLKVANKAIAISESIDAPLFESQFLYLKGECCYYHNNYPEAVGNYSAALEIFRQINDVQNMAETLNSIGLVYYYLGEYNQAAENLYQALDLFSKQNLIEDKARVYSNLAMVFTRTGDFKESIRHYELAAEINAGGGKKTSLAVNYNGVGVGYYNLEQYDSSKVYYNKALFLFRELKNKKREAIALNNIANIYLNTKDSMELALDFYKRAVDVFGELGDNRSEAFALEGLGGVYRELGQYGSAINTFYKSLQLADDYEYYLKQLNYLDLALTYEKQGRIDEAYHAFKIYDRYQDTLRQEERHNQVAELEKQYETQQKEAEIERLSVSREIDQLQIERDKELRAFGIILILVLVAAIFFVSVAYLNKRRINDLLSLKNLKIEEQRKELELLNASKNKFFSIIAHDLKNPFHTVMGYSYLIHKQYDRFSDIERKQYASDIYKSSNSIFRLLQNLLDWSRSQTGRLEYTPREFNFCDIYESIERLLLPAAADKNIQLIAEMPEQVTVYSDPMMVETVMRNLLNNAIKFTNEKGQVKTVLKSEKETVTVCVEDTGVGINPDDLNKLFQIDSKVKRKGTNEEDGTGLGLVICNEFVRKNGGHIWGESVLGQGSRFYFTLPRTNGHS
ncbi:tetratricopeptide repeat-containing sensor histidine kinase [uncultured Sunxiuqinia sp.]|uniref:tetratricopeptide repeat-containing sensor histidine kinase n=1 Tax=uncultured Sunxiuqinia sp. TaxID=1573825 RepID=UPI002AA721B6|nr:tetratricopeptide repeat-containing sensor histidine kinase [uncultured Sunxiuqinia sp.]